MPFPQTSKSDKKPGGGLAVILGIGGKKPREEAPPPFGGAAPSPGPDSPAEEAAEGGGSLTPDMLDYHGGAENCGACVHFSAPSTCDRFPDPVEEAAWCRGFQGGAGMEQEPLETSGEQPGGEAA